MRQSKKNAKGECHRGIHDGKCMNRYRKEIIEYQHAGDCAKIPYSYPVRAIRRTFSSTMTLIRRSRPRQSDSDRPSMLAVITIAASATYAILTVLLSSITYHSIHDICQYLCLRLFLRPITMMNAVHLSPKQPADARSP